MRLEPVDEERGVAVRVLAAGRGDHELDLAAEALALEDDVGEGVPHRLLDGGQLGVGGRGGGAEDELDVVQVGVLAAEALGGADGEEALAQDGGAGGERVGLLHRVRRQQHGAARGDLGQRLPHAALGHRVHGGARLVEDQHVRVAHQGDRQAQLALVAPRELAGLLPRERREAHALHRQVGVASHVRDALDAAVELEVLPRGQEIQRVELRAYAHRLARQAGVQIHVGVPEVDVPRGRRHLGPDHVHDGRLAGAVGTQESHDLALAEAQGDIVHRQGLSELLRYVQEAQEIVLRLFDPCDLLAHGAEILHDHVAFCLGAKGAATEDSREEVAIGPDEQQEKGDNLQREVGDGEAVGPPRARVGHQAIVSAHDVVGIETNGHSPEHGTDREEEVENVRDDIGVLLDVSHVVKRLRKLERLSATATKIGRHPSVVQHSWEYVPRTRGQDQSIQAQTRLRSKETPTAETWP